MLSVHWLINVFYLSSGFPFTFKLNLKNREAHYEPCTDVDQMSRYNPHLPCKLQTGITYSADDVYMFVYELGINNQLSHKTPEEKVPDT